MAGDINRVTLVGRLTRDPELRHIPSGTAVLELGLAVNGRQQDEAGNWAHISTYVVNQSNGVIHVIDRVVMPRP